VYYLSHFVGWAARPPFVAHKSASDTPLWGLGVKKRSVDAALDSRLRGNDGGRDSDVRRGRFAYALTELMVITHLDKPNIV
jgi:hypothetical protein